MSKSGKTQPVPEADSGPAFPSDKIIVGMLQGIPPEKMARAVGVAEADVPAAVAEAKRRLTLAADYNRDEQLGISIKRLEDCYARALKGGDIKTCVIIQKELNRLTDLYRPTVRHIDADGRSAAELAAVRAHLLPLGLAPDTAPTEELARLAISRLMELEHGR